MSWPTSSAVFASESEATWLTEPGVLSMLRSEVGKGMGLDADKEIRWQRLERLRLKVVEIYHRTLVEESRDAKDIIAPGVQAGLLPSQAQQAANTANSTAAVRPHPDEPTEATDWEKLFHGVPMGSGNSEFSWLAVAATLT